ncbi:MAG: triose-phosphate isomerase [Nitrospirae bacterium]|nr:triose-phosphate isomerase [Nitrospirota bacterium]
MHPGRVPVMAGNWKMHKGIHDTGGFVRELAAQLKERGPIATQVIVAPVFTSLSVAQQAAWGSPIRVAAQNCHWEAAGAFTGEVAAAMLQEIGIGHVILGHSERRQHFGETDATVAGRTQAALAAGLVPIVCVGEVLAERQAGATEAVLARQLGGALGGLSAGQVAGLIIAYEPVWAIGTGQVATSAQAQAAHAFIRHWLDGRFGPGTAAATRILYGGSAKPDNVAELLDCPDVDGCLIGGASLREESFMAMVDAAEKRAGKNSG